MYAHCRNKFISIQASGPNLKFGTVLTWKLLSKSVFKSKSKAIQECIKNQLQEDLVYEQMSIKELVDPFTGEQVKKSNK